MKQSRTSMASVMVTLILTTGNAEAAECGFLAKLLDVCKIAQEFGREAAIEVARGMDVATLNARELTNQFGALVGDLHGLDAGRAARAKSIFQGVLGDNFDAKQEFDLQYSVRLIGKPSESMEIDSYVFGRDNNDAVKALFLNDKPAFKGRKLNGTSIEPLSDAVIQKRVQHAVAIYLAPISGCVIGAKGIEPQGDLFRGDRARKIQCKKTQEEHLANVVLSLQGTPSPIPVTNRFTDVAPGGIVALLARKDELTALASKNPAPFLEVWVHVAGKPDSATLRFSDPQTSTVTPQKIDLSEFRDPNKCITSSKPHGDLCFIWVPLRLEAISKFVDERQPTK